MCAKVAFAHSMLKKMYLVILAFIIFLCEFTFQKKINRKYIPLIGEEDRYTSVKSY